MSSENGSPVFKIIASDKFTRTAKSLKKGYKSKRSEQEFVDCVAGIVEALTQDPRPDSSRLEPLPKGVDISDWEFRKLMFDLAGRSGASGEGRLMYLLKYSECLLKLVWIYTHEEFKGRPPEKDLKQMLQELLEEQDNA